MLKKITGLKDLLMLNLAHIDFPDGNCFRQSKRPKKAISSNSSAASMKKSWVGSNKKVIMIQDQEGFGNFAQTWECHALYNPWLPTKEHLF